MEIRTQPQIDMRNLFPGSQDLVTGMNPLASVFLKARPGQFLRAIQQNKSPLVDVKSLQDYRKIATQGRLAIDDTGNAGYAVKPDGNLVSVFSNMGGKGLGREAVQDSLQHGATKLDAFESVPQLNSNLRKFYENFGFKVKDRLKFDPKYAPEGLPKGAKPDVVLMELVQELLGGNSYKGFLGK